MSNMSYCRFENTVRALSDCFDALLDMQGDLSSLSESERRYAKQLIVMCQSLADDFGDES